MRRNGTRFSQGLRKRWDGRNSIHKVEELIRVLRELGYKDGEPIPHRDLEYHIRFLFGCDDRTIKKHLALAVELDYLRPAGHQIYGRKSVTVRTMQSTHIREYSSLKGHSHYIFGNRAPRLYQETLNPKYVSPSPSKKVDEELVSNTRKNMCASHKGFRDYSEVRSSDSLEGTIKKDQKEERKLCDTHILLDTKNEKGKKNASFMEKAIIRDENLVSNRDLVSNILVSNFSVLDTKIKACPKCGRKGCLTSRWVLNSKKKRYSPYYYFKHYNHGEITWCYIPRRKAI